MLPLSFTQDSMDQWQFNKIDEGYLQLTTHGDWLCDAKDAKMGDTKKSFVCFRFLPTVKNSSTSDVRFATGPINVK